MSAHQPESLFYSYAHEDEPLRGKLDIHLSLLRRQGLHISWYDRDIQAGDSWKQVINDHLETASIILLLISPDFLASDYCYEMEMQRALERQRIGEARVIPIILRPCGWQQSHFGYLQALPRDGRPLTTWANLDEAFLDVEQNLRALLEYPSAVPLTEKTSKTTRQNREAMLVRLQAMYQEWLDNALQEVAWIDLPLAKKPGATSNSANLIVRRGAQSDLPLAPDTSVRQVYEQANRELLILGAPGVGKSTLLYQLGRDLVTQARQHSFQPLPILFPLSSWAQKRLPLQEWMIELLCSHFYEVPRWQSQQWMQEEHILPLLDGLDEMEEEARPACIVAINKYRREKPLCPLVVSSRSQEYRDASAKEQLHLQTAIEVQLLSSAQLDEVLIRAGESVTALQSELNRNPELRDLARTPLWLNVLVLTFKNKPVHKLPQQREELQKQVFARYIQRMVEEKGQPKRYPLEPTIRYLSWLAEQTQKQKQTVFFVESLQPNWLGEQLFIWYRRSIRIVIGLIVTLVFVLDGIMFGGGIFIVTIWLLFGNFLAGFLVKGILKENEIRLAERISWSWKEATPWIFIGLGGGLLFGLVIVMFLRLFGQQPFEGFIWVSGINGMIGAMIGKLTPNPYIERRALSPGEGLRRSLKNGLRVALLSGLTIGFTSGILFGPVDELYEKIIFGLKLGVGLGLFFGLLVGFNAVIQHVLLRFWLQRANIFPFRVEAFLDDARSRHLLLCMGGSYQFVHRLLRDYLIDLDDAISHMQSKREDNLELNQKNATLEVSKQETNKYQKRKKVRIVSRQRRGISRIETQKVKRNT